VTDSSSGRYGGPNPVGGDGANWQTPGEPQGWSHPPPPVPSGFGGPPAGQQIPRIRRSRKRLWLALAAGAAIIAVVAVVVGTVVNGHGGAGSPTDAVKGYLEALARGDADAALSFSDDRPADTEFLTTDILKQQISKLPITDIQVKDQPAPGDPKTRVVHAAARFGDQTSRGVITPKRRNGRWYLPSAVLKLHPSQYGSASASASANTVTLFGKPVGDSVHYVFPGWLAAGSSNPYLEVQAMPELLNGLGTDGVVLQTTISMGEAGTKAVNDALVAVFAKCEQSHEIKPAYPCSGIGLDPAQAVDGTVQWGHADLSKLTQGFDVAKLSVNIVGLVDIPVSAQLKSGGTAQFTGRHSVNGTADLSKVPPELKFP
jgi:hypothetical protein